MVIHVLGGLTIENFAGPNWKGCKEILLQMKLCELGYTSGVQIRVGHPTHNTERIKTLAEKFEETKLPYIIHGAAENCGVDLGETLDELNLFKKYKSLHPEVSWYNFNYESLITCSGLFDSNPKSLDKRVVIHPGYAKISKMGLKKAELERARNQVQRSLSRLSSINFSLETVVEQNTDETGQNYYGFGATPDDMQELLKLRFGLDVLMDFTHINATANAGLSGGFEYLIRRFLELPVSKFTHFSGLLDLNYDAHNGFVPAKNSAASNQHSIGVIKEALQQLERKHGEVYVAGEIRWHKMTLDQAKEEIDNFRLSYC